MPATDNSERRERRGDRWEHLLTVGRAEAAGWYGTAAIILAYALVSFKVINASSLLYQLLNLTGALGIIAVSLLKRVRQSLTLNVFWAAIAVVALVKLGLE